MSRLVAVLDANVLYGIVPADLLVSLALRDIYRAHWSQELLHEASRNVAVNRPDLDPNKIRLRFQLMDRALNAANTAAASLDLVNSMTNHVAIDTFSPPP